MRTEAFPPCKKELLNVIYEDKLSDYPMAAGDEHSRKIIVDYLKREGFQSEAGISEDNIIFTVSTTQAFNIIMKRNKKRGDYVSPDASVIEIEMQDLIAASNDASFDVNDYTSGYGEEEIF